MIGQPLAASKPFFPLRIRLGNANGLLAPAPLEHGAAWLGMPLRRGATTRTRLSPYETCSFVGCSRDWLPLSDARSFMKAELTEYGSVSILLFIGRDAHFKGHQLVMRQPGLVPCRRY